MVDFASSGSMMSPGNFLKGSASATDAGFGGGSSQTPALLQAIMSDPEKMKGLDPRLLQLLQVYMQRNAPQGSTNFLQPQEEEQGGGMWNLLGPVGNLVGQTMDGKKGINWGSTGRSLMNNVIGGIGVATGNPMMIGQGVKGVFGQSFG